MKQPSCALSIMNLPTQYSYNPRLWMVSLTVGAGFAWLTLIGLECGCWPHGFSLWFGVLPVMLGLLMTVRRLVFKSYLVLDKDALILPTGFGRVRTKRVPYASIERVWETRLPFTVVLSVGTKEGKFEVVSAMLPDASSYVDIGKFLYAQIRQPSG
jgi:hypothetical protein